MDCNEFEQSLADVLEADRLGPAEREHMAQCAKCARLSSELELIAGRAKELASVEPEVDLWPRIKAQLEAEGIIHDSNSSSGNKPKMVYSFPVGRPRH